MKVKYNRDASPAGFAENIPYKVAVLALHPQGSRRAGKAVFVASQKGMAIINSSGIYDDRKRYIQKRMHLDCNIVLFSAKAIREDIKFDF